MLNNILKTKGLPVEAFLILLCTLFLPLKAVYSNAALIAFFVVVLVKYYPNFRSFKVDAGVWLILLMILIFTLGLFFGPEFSTEIKVVERRLPFLLVPIAFIILPNKKRTEALKYFWEGIFLLAICLSIYSLISAFLVFHEIGHLPVDGPRVNEITFLDRPYFGLVQVLAVSYIFSLYYEQGFNLNPIRHIGLAISILSLGLLVARLALAALVVVTLYFIFCYLYKQKLLSYKTIILIVIAFMGSLTALLNYDRFTERFQYALEGKGEARILIWRCAYDQAIDTDFDFLLGHKSAGGTQLRLRKCYQKEFENKSYWGWVHEYKNDFNTHNEYINLYLSYGLVGLMSFLVLLGYVYKKSFSDTNLSGQLFAIIFFINCFTENLLARQVSIFIFVIGATAIIVINRQASNYAEEN